MTDTPTVPYVLSDKGLAEIRQRVTGTCSCCGENVHDFDVPDVLELLDDVDRLRPLVAAATEFTFRPDYGDAAGEFAPYDNPEIQDAIVLSYRGPSEEGADPDRWIIGWRRDCRSRAKQKFVYELSAGNRTDTFIADTRFTLAEAIALVPEMLQRLQDVRIPELRRLVASWAEEEPERPASAAPQQMEGGDG